MKFELLLSPGRFLLHVAGHDGTGPGAFEIYHPVCVDYRAVAWVLVVWLKRRWGRDYEGRTEASSEEILDELEREFTPCRRTVIRTQTEYLPFLLECVRENIDGGLEDPQVMALLERIELQKPDQERCAMFTVVSTGMRSDLHLRWIRDACDRIELRIQGAPRIIRALREYKRKIPKAVIGAC